MSCFVNLRNKIEKTVNAGLLVDVEFLVGARNMLHRLRRSCLGNFMWQLNFVLLQVIKDFFVRKYFCLPVLQTTILLN